MTLPRYRRPPLRPVGTATQRRLQQRRLAYAVVARRARGVCEMPGCGLRQDPLDPHHTFRRGHLPGIPAQVCDTPELILGVCRPCHDAIERGDVELGDRARRLAVERYAELHDLFLVGAFAADPLEAMRELVRIVEARSG